MFEAVATITRTPFTAWIVTFTLSSTMSAGLAQDANVKPAIWKVFEERQAAAETAEVAWTTRSSRSAESLKMALWAANRQDEPTPTEDVVDSFESKLVLSGERARHESATFSLTGDDRGEPVSFVTAFDGTRGQTLTDRTRQGRTSSGVILSQNAFDDWKSIDLLGLTLTLRPLRPEAFGPSPRRWNVDNNPAVVDGRECLVLASRTNDSTQRVYLDPAREYVPLRFVRQFGGYPGIQIDLQYGRQEEPQWVPSSWTANVIFGGNPDHWTRSEHDVQQVSLGQTVPDELFTIDYPAGAKVGIPRGDGKLPQIVIVADDGELVPQRQAIAEATAGGWKSWYYVLAALGAAILGAALLLWRRRISAA